MAEKTVRADVWAAIVAGVLGLIWISAIWMNLVFPPSVAAGGATVLYGNPIALTEHEWGFNQFPKGGPTICVPTGQSVTIQLTNTGQNLHGFQVVDDSGGKVAGLNTTDLLKPGQSRDIPIQISQAGTYHYICPVSGHQAKGMVGVFVVQSSCP